MVNLQDALDVKVAMVDREEHLYKASTPSFNRFNQEMRPFGIHADYYFDLDGSSYYDDPFVIFNNSLKLYLFDGYAEEIHMEEYIDFNPSNAVHKLKILKTLLFMGREKQELLSRGLAEKKDARDQRDTIIGMQYDINSFYRKYFIDRTYTERSTMEESIRNLRASGVIKKSFLRDVLDPDVVEATLIDARIKEIESGSSRRTTKKDAEVECLYFFLNRVLRYNDYYMNYGREPVYEVPEKPAVKALGQISN